jgi:hypothetical protein
MAKAPVQTGDPSNPQPLEFMVREIQALNLEIATLKREIRAVLGLVITAAGLVATLQEKLSTNLAAIILPFLLTGLATYSFNLNADVASLAEQRDRLSNYVNRTSGTKVFLTRIISDQRRGSAGTAATYILAGMIVVASLIAGFFFAWEESNWVKAGYTILAVASIVAMFFAVMDLPLARNSVNKALDDELGDSDRPLTSPSSDKGRFDLLSSDSGWFGRRVTAGSGTGKSKDRAHPRSWHTGTAQAELIVSDAAKELD